YYDSELEKENIESDIKAVVVFTKIPKNSVKIPIVGGYTYSPDFAYVVDFEDGKKQLNLVVETINKHHKDLSSEEEMKIKSAEKLFKSNFIDVKFRRQMTNDEMINIINEIKK
ncbi:MAG: type III restriction-modification system endonuclease, partial [Bacilli bacterium]